MNRIKGIMLGLWLPAVIVLVVFVASAGSTSLYFPPASEVWSRIVEDTNDGTFARELSFSMGNYALGLLAALVLGVGAGVLLGDQPRVLAVLTPILNFMRAVPHVAFVPVIILALGIGAAPKVFLIALACVWPILLNTLDGVRGVNPAILETAAAYRIPHGLRLRRVVLMGALPQVLAGVRIALSVGLVMVVVSEMYGSAEGIGYYLLSSGQRFDVTGVWACTVVIGVVGYLVNVLFVVVEHFALGWYFQRPRRARANRMKEVTA